MGSVLRYYELDRAEVDRLRQLRREAGKRSSWQSYDIVRSYQTYLGLSAWPSFIRGIK